MRERDKFLTEAIGECWHKREIRFKVCFTHTAFSTKTGFKSKEEADIYCAKQREIAEAYVECYTLPVKTNNDFSTWEGFGKLFTWAQKQEWWFHFMTGDTRVECCEVDVELINPERFADAVFAYLKEGSDDKSERQKD